MNITKSERAYLAGFFDGEGCFSITRRQETRNKTGFSLQPYIEVASTNTEVIEWLSEKINRSFTFWRPRKGNCKNAFTLQITGIENIITFINLLLPFLIVKKEVAINLKKFCLSRQGKMKLARKKRGFTKKELSIFDEIRRLNKRGRR